MGKRNRRRGHVETTVAEYTDAAGNVLALRESISAPSARKLAEPPHGPASLEDDWRRRMEVLFERFAVRWTIADLPLTDQRELLGRYRLADSETQQWVHATLAKHVAIYQPEIDAT
ncbi:MAG: hypothetical protein H0U42_01170 [Thermoleophilaceae bacterium]|nr:hypothetical protein [Thermoleophilaceae bacterium]